MRPIQPGEIIVGQIDVIDENGHPTMTGQPAVRYAEGWALIPTHLLPPYPQLVPHSLVTLVTPIEGWPW